jgi:hypothetical protein
MVNESNKLQEAKVEKDAKKSKMGQDKLMDFTLCMVLNTSEPLPDDLEDENGDPITEHKNIILMYKRILNCSSVGMVQQQLIHYLNDKKTFVQTYHWQPVQSFIWESAYWPATTSQPPR